MTSTDFPRWVWADAAPFTEALRVETAHDQFVDYVRIQGAWRQKTCRMSNKESVTPERFTLGDWRDGADRYPGVDDEMSVWLETTYNAIGVTA